MVGQFGYGRVRQYYRGGKTRIRPSPGKTSANHSVTAVLQGQDDQAFVPHDHPDPHVDDETGLFQPAAGKG